jgi:hypothetical protein
MHAATVFIFFVTFLSQIPSLAVVLSTSRFLFFVGTDEEAGRRKVAVGVAAVAGALLLLSLVLPVALRQTNITR